MTPDPADDIRRFSSRRQRLDHAFLERGCRARSPTGESPATSAAPSSSWSARRSPTSRKVQIVCNSELDAADVAGLEARPGDGAQGALERSAVRGRGAAAPGPLPPAARAADAAAGSRSGSCRRTASSSTARPGSSKQADGTKTCFLGSINETKSAFAAELRDPLGGHVRRRRRLGRGGVRGALGGRLPAARRDRRGDRARRRARRDPLRGRCTTEELPAAALAESPIYRGGEQLQPWQRSFVTMFLAASGDVRASARLLLADEVGVGKTLSLAASAMISALLDDGPVLILCPSTLTLQWQVELADKLGIPSAVWSSTKKVWTRPQGPRHPDPRGRGHRPLPVPDRHRLDRPDLPRLRGARATCSSASTAPWSWTRRTRRAGAAGSAKQQTTPNNLLDFMLRIGPRTKNLLLGTATPIQTEVSELWDLLRILNARRGLRARSRAVRPLGGLAEGAFPWSRATQIAQPTSATRGNGCGTRCRPASEDALFAERCGCSSALPIRRSSPTEASARSASSSSRRSRRRSPRTSSASTTPSSATRCCAAAQTLEERGPAGARRRRRSIPSPDAPATAYPGVGFSGLGLLTNHPFDLAYAGGRGVHRAP